MAGSWIDSASIQRTAPIGCDGMHRDAILALPATEREAALAELVRARRCVLRYGYEHADEILPMLGLDPLTDAEAAAGPLPKPKTKPAQARPPALRLRPPARPRRQPYKECVGCHEIKPAGAFKGRSYRCRECA